MGSESRQEAETLPLPHKGICEGLDTTSSGSLSLKLPSQDGRPLMPFLPSPPWGKSPFAPSAAESQQSRPGKKERGPNCSGRPGTASPWTESEERKRKGNTKEKEEKKIIKNSRYGASVFRFRPQK